MGEREREDKDEGKKRDSRDGAKKERQKRQDQKREAEEMGPKLKRRSHRAKEEK